MAQNPFWCHNDGGDDDERMLVVMVMNNPTNMMVMVGSVRYVILSLKPGNRREAEVKIQRSQIWFLIDRSRVDEEDKFERDVIMMMMMMMMMSRRRRIRILLHESSFFWVVRMNILWISNNSRLQCPWLHDYTTCSLDVSKKFWNRIILGTENCPLNQDRRTHSLHCQCDFLL